MKYFKLTENQKIYKPNSSCSSTAPFFQLNYLIRYIYIKFYVEHCLYINSMLSTVYILNLYVEHCLIQRIISFIYIKFYIYTILKSV